MPPAPDLRPFQRPTGAVYGPVESRRFGRTLGVNVFPPGLKACSFNCVYCQLGRGVDPAKREIPWPPAAGLVAEIDAAVSALDPSVTAGLGGIVFSGDGEPTLHPEFREIVRGTVAIRDARLPGRRIVVLSNGTALDRPDVREGLALADDRVLKLDAGTNPVAASVNEPFGAFDLEAYESRLRTIQGVTIQSMFVRGRADNTQTGQLRAWRDRIGRIRPIEVQIYTLDRRPPFPDLLPVPPPELQEIGRDLYRNAGIPVRVFAGSGS